MASNDPLLRTVLVIVALVLFVPLLMMLFMMPFMGMWGGGHMWNGGSWDGMWNGMGWLWPVTWLLMLGVVAAVGYALYRAVSGSARRDQALEELRAAYARGDLSDEEYEKRRERLRREKEP